MSRKRQKTSVVEDLPVQGGPLGTTSRILIGIAIILFALTRYYTLFVLTAHLNDKYQITDLYSEYFEYCIKAYDLQKVPYQGEFKVEYPPVGWWTIYAPRLLDDRVISNPQDPSQFMPVFYSYFYAFRGQMCLIDIASFVIFLMIVIRRRPGLAGWAALFYVILTAILGRLIYDRLDVGLLFLLLLWAYAWARSLEESKWSNLWNTAAFVFIGLSVSYKVIPVICLPFLVFSEFFAPRRIARMAITLSSLVAGVCLPFIIQFFISGAGIFDLFKHHAERGIQLESLYSTLMWLLATPDSPVYVSHSHGAFNLSGNMEHSMKTFSTLTMLGFLIGMGLWALSRWSHFGRRAAYVFSCYVVAAAVILANVLSPQYFIWAFPLLLLVALELLPKGQILPWIYGVLLLTVAVSTTWLFPYHYFCYDESSYGLIPVSRGGALPASSVCYVVLALRNLTYLGIIAGLGWYLYKRINVISSAKTTSNESNSESIGRSTDS